MLHHQTNRDAAGIYEVVWPGGRRTTDPVMISEALPTLSGKVFGQLWSMGFKGDEMFRMIREELAKTYSRLRFIDHDVFGGIHGNDEREVIGRLPERLHQRGCNAVITAVGA